MKSTYLLLLATILVCISACQPDEANIQSPETVFLKFYGGNAIQKAIDVDQTISGDGYLILGTSSSFHGDNDDKFNRVYFVKTNKEGDEELENIYTEYPAKGVAIQEINNGYLILANCQIETIIENEVVRQEKIWLFKTNEMGMIQQDIVLRMNSISDDNAYNMTVVDNEILIVGGTTKVRQISAENNNSTYDNQEDVFYASLRLDDFSENWGNQTEGFEGREYGVAMFKNSDDTYTILANSDVNNQKGFLLIEVLADGRQYGFKNYLEDKPELVAKTMKPTATGYVLLGTNFQSSESSNLVVATINGNRDLTGQESYGGINSEQYLAGGIDVLPDEGGFIVSGTVMTENGFEDYYLLNIAKDLNPMPVWEHSFGSEEHDGSTDVLHLSSGGYVLTGYNSFVDANIAFNNTMMTLIKTNDQGELLPAE